MKVMKKYAIIRLSGNQYKVSEGDEILVNKLNGKPQAEVLMVVNGEKVKVGKPVLKDEDIKLEVIRDVEKGEKIHVQTYRAKSRYRRKIGFRALHTRLQVRKIA